MFFDCRPSPSIEQGRSNYFTVAVLAVVPWECNIANLPAGGDLRRTGSVWGHSECDDLQRALLADHPHHDTCDAPLLILSLLLVVVLLCRITHNLQNSDRTSCCIDHRAPRARTMHEPAANVHRADGMQNLTTPRCAGVVPEGRLLMLGAGGFASLIILYEVQNSLLSLASSLMQ